MPRPRPVTLKPSGPEGLVVGAAVPAGGANDAPPLPVVIARWPINPRLFQIADLEALQAWLAENNLTVAQMLAVMRRYPRTILRLSREAEKESRP